MFLYCTFSFSFDVCIHVYIVHCLLFIVYFVRYLSLLPLPWGGFSDLQTILAVRECVTRASYFNMQHQFDMMLLKSSQALMEHNSMVERGYTNWSSVSATVTKSTSKLPLFVLNLARRTDR